MDENITPPAGENPPPPPGSTPPGTPPGTAPGDSGDAPRPDDGPRVSASDVRDVARLRRSTTDRHVAGVAGGLARHLDVDPILIRVGFVVLTIFGGTGLFLYGALWILLPDDTDGDRAMVDLDPRNRSLAVLVVGALAAVGFLGDVLGFRGDHDGFFFPAIPLLVVGAIAFIVLRKRERRRAHVVDQRLAGGEPARQPWEATYAAGPKDAFNADVRANPEKYKDMAAWKMRGDGRSGYRWVRDPRKKGPLLFWIALPLIAVALGILGVVDLGGTHVMPAAYPALALAVVAALLLLGSFWGRAGGLILLGLLLVPVTLVTTVADTVDGKDVTYAPATVAEMPSAGADGSMHLYEVETGRLVVDLTKVRELSSLDGQTVRAEAKVGEVIIIVPRTLTVDATADTAGPGGYEVFGTDGGGIDTELTLHQAGADTADDASGPTAPHLTVVGHVNVGHIEIRSK